MNPATVRIILRVASVLLGVATYMVGKWELGSLVDFNTFLTALLTGVGSVGTFAYSVTAPGDKRVR